MGGVLFGKKCQDTIEDEVVFLKEACGILWFFLLN